MTAYHLPFSDSQLRFGDVSFAAWMFCCYNRDKPDAVAAAERLCMLLAEALQVRAGRGAAGRVAVLPGADHGQIAQFQPHLVVVPWGDGSILTTAHALQGMPVPVVGINFGKLGYLAEYSLEEFIDVPGPDLRRHGAADGTADAAGDDLSVAAERRHPVAGGGGVAATRGRRAWRSMTWSSMPANRSA